MFEKNEPNVERSNLKKRNNFKTNTHLCNKHFNIIPTNEKKYSNV